MKVNLFEIFSKQVSGVLAARPNMPPEDAVGLQVSLANMAMKVYPTEQNYVDQIFKQTLEYLVQKDISNISHSVPVSKPMLQLVKLPIDSYEDIFPVLSLNEYVPSFSVFNFDLRNDLAG